MISLFKADLYRIQKERVGLLPLAILTIIMGLATFFTRENDFATAGTLLSGLSLFIVLTVISSILYFWGNDFQNRTINNLLSKGTSRSKLFSYKVIGTLLLSSLYNLYSFVILALFRQVFAGANEWSETLEIFAQNLPFFLVLVAFAVLIFNLILNNAFAITSYVVYVLFLEQILSVAGNYLFKSAFLDEYLWVHLYQLSLTTVEGSMLPVAIVTFILFIGLAYLLFRRREFK